jgi:large repetitive protein
MRARSTSIFALVPMFLSLAGCSGGDGGATELSPAGGSAQAGSGGSGGAGKGGAGGAGAASGKAGQGGKAGGGGSSQAGSSGQAGAGGTGGSPATCSKDSDCMAAPTMPPGCAEARCDAKTGKCVQYAKDADKDMSATSKCKAVDGVTPIVLGEDCDDTNPDVNPKGWDGPAGDGHPDHCGDGVDQDCSGTDDDDKLKDGTTCACSPGDTQDCSQDASGKPIKFPMLVSGKPVGICALGHQTCVDSGKWGPCVDAVAPAVEVCDVANALDEDCDGLTDDNDPDALGKVTWICDADGDGFLDLQAGLKQVACKPDPADCAGAWLDVAKAPKASDCDDGDFDTFPGAKEICDGVRNDCDPTKVADEGASTVATWYRDDDGDKHLLKNDGSGGPTQKVQCDKPGTTAEDCPPGMSTCTDLWYKQGAAPFDDCDDTNPEVHPGVWDGPAVTVRSGFVAPGVKAEFFKITSGAVPDFSTLQPETATRTDVAINFDAGQGALGPDLPVDVGARWTGAIVVPEDGEYTFYTTTDDGVRLWVGDLTTPVINDWNPHPPTEQTAKVTLSKGAAVPFQMEWFDSGGGAVAMLRWQGPSFDKQVLTVALEPTAEQLIDRCGDGLDNDCNGTIDDGRIQTKGSGSVLGVGCTPACNPIDIDPTKNSSQACGMVNSVGICHPGAQYCQPDGTWSACGGVQDKQADTCGDGLDNDCNGVVDDGKTTYCADADQDTYCDLGQCGNFCPQQQPAGWRLKSGECNAKGDCPNGDGDVDVHPDALELCDGKDNDCNGGVDDAYPTKGQGCQAGNGHCMSYGKNVCSADKHSVQCDAVPGQPLGCSKSPYANGNNWDWNCNGQADVCDYPPQDCNKYNDPSGYCDATANQLATTNGISKESACDLIGKFGTQQAICVAPACGANFKTFTCYTQPVGFAVFCWAQNVNTDTIGCK